MDSFVGAVMVMVFTLHISEIQSLNRLINQNKIKLRVYLIIIFLKGARILRQTERIMLY